MGQLTTIKKGVILKTRFSSRNWNMSLGNRSINCCKKRLTVSVFSMLDLAHFRTSNHLLAFSGAPSASLHKSSAALEPYASRNKLKPISMTSHRPENATYPHLGHCGLVFN